MRSLAILIHSDQSSSLLKVRFRRRFCRINRHGRSLWVDWDSGSIVSGSPSFLQYREFEMHENVIKFMKCYFDRLHAIEALDANVINEIDAELNGGHIETPRSKALWKDVISKKRSVYQEFWQRVDDYWEPDCLNSDPDHDWNRIKTIHVFFNGKDCYAFRYAYDKMTDCELLFIIKDFGGDLKIVDHLF